MTDKQLAILIRSWANTLEGEIDYLKEELPEEFKKVEEGIMGFPVISYPILGGLCGLFDEMRQAEETLTEEVEAKLPNPFFPGLSGLIRTD